MLALILIDIALKTLGAGFGAAIADQKQRDKGHEHPEDQAEIRCEQFHLFAEVL